MGQSHGEFGYFQRHRLYVYVRDPSPAHSTTIQMHARMYIHADTMRQTTNFQPTATNQQPPAPSTSSNQQPPTNNHQPHQRSLTLFLPRTPLFSLRCCFFLLQRWSLVKLFTCGVIRSYNFSRCVLFNVLV